MNLAYIPQPPLSKFVAMLWLYDGYSQPHAKERLLPSGEMELVINLRENESRIYDRRDFDRVSTLPGSILCGAQTEFCVIDTAQQASVIGAHFHPGGAFPFFRLPAAELQDQIVSLDALWGAEANYLRERLLAAKTHQERFVILEQYLLQQLVRPLERHGAVDYALQYFSRSASIADVTGKIGLSPRRFIEVFHNQVGITPKVFCRIRRFQKVLYRLQKQQTVNWADLALACGYYDQPHFIHDFRAFSGINPSTYLANRTPHLNHVPLTE